MVFKTGTEAVSSDVATNDSNDRKSREESNSQSRIVESSQLQSLVVTNTGSSNSCKNISTDDSQFANTVEEVAALLKSNASFDEQHRDTHQREGTTENASTDGFLKLCINANEISLSNCNQKFSEMTVAEQKSSSIEDSIHSHTGVKPIVSADQSPRQNYHLSKQATTIINSNREAGDEKNTQNREASLSNGINSQMQDGNTRCDRDVAETDSYLAFTGRPGNCLDYVNTKVVVDSSVLLPPESLIVTENSAWAETYQNEIIEESDSAMNKETRCLVTTASSVELEAKNEVPLRCSQADESLMSYTDSCFGAMDSDLSTIPVSSSDCDQVNSSRSSSSEDSDEWSTDTSSSEYVDMCTTTSSNSSWSSSCAQSSDESSERNDSISDLNSSEVAVLNTSSGLECSHITTIFSDSTAVSENERQHHVLCYACGRYISSSDLTSHGSSVSSTSSDLERAQNASDECWYPIDDFELNSEGETTSYISVSSDISGDDHIFVSEASTSDDSDDSAILLCTCRTSNDRRGVLVPSDSWDTSSVSSMVSVDNSSLDANFAHPLHTNGSRFLIINLYVTVTM